MNNRYIEYIKDNPQGYWFKRKLFGWGWTPVKWQGWMVIGVYLGLVFALTLTIDENAPNQEIGFMFILPLAILTTMLIVVCYKKGEKPKWQWGLPDNNKK